MDQQTLFMFILSNQIISLFPADTFFRKQLISRPHYKRNKYKLLEKRSCVSVWMCFAPTMPNVGSRYSKFGFGKKQTKNCIWFWKKTTTAEVGFLGSISQTRRKCIYENWTTGAGWGAGAGRHSDFSLVSMCLPFWKPIWLDWNWRIIHECSRTYRNNAILSFDFINCQSEQFTMAIRLIFTQLIQMITDIHI